jgi:hypothetical protein
MALWATLHINSDRIGGVEIRRCDRLDLDNPDVADAVSTYTVAMDNTFVGTVRHRYGDGGWRLLELAAGLIVREGP